MALNDPTEEGYDRIPESREAVAQYLELYAMSGDPEDLEQFVDFDFTHTLLTVQFKAADLRQMDRILDAIYTITTADGLEPVIGGISMTDKDISQFVQTGQAYSLLFALQPYSCY